MYETNVIGTLNVTQALLPALTASGDGTVVVLSSTAGLATYEGGGGYVAAKHGEHVLAETLRLEIVGTPVRVIEVAPGMVKTEEFATTRFRGDTEKAAKVYAGVDAPLTADDVADTITWAVTRPQPRQHRPPGGPPPRPGLQLQGPPHALTAYSGWTAPFRSLVRVIRTSSPVTMTERAAYGLRRLHNGPRTGLQSCRGPHHKGSRASRG